MKKVLLTLLASFALPLSVHAESIYLIMHSGAGANAGGGFLKIEVESMDQCIEQGEIFIILDLMEFIPLLILIAGISFKLRI